MVQISGSTIGDQNWTALVLHRRPPPPLRGLSLHAGPYRRRTRGDLQKLPGILRADAYSAYDALYASGRIVEIGCLMHARRKFYKTRTSDPKRSHEALAWI